MASATPGYRQIIPLQDQEKIQKTPQKIKCATVELEYSALRFASGIFNPKLLLVVH
jgi:hypothetical protein